MKKKIKPKPKAKRKAGKKRMVLKGKKKVIDSFVEPKPKPEPKYDGPTCDVCGAPVAPGQTAVCREHIRSN